MNNKVVVDIVVSMCKPDKLEVMLVNYLVMFFVRVIKVMYIGMRTLFGV